VPTYHADVTRDGKFWLIRVPEIDRSTQALRYQDVRAMAAGLIEVMTGLGGADYDVELTVRLPGAVEDHLARAAVLRAEADGKRAEAAAESRAAVRELVAMGLSQREAGQVLGLSFQRVHQLVHG
jgi:hypothetical protein